MSEAIFVDTNVLLYARDASEPLKQPRALAWLEYLWRERLGRTSVQVLSEYYQNVTRKLRPGLPPEDAWDDVRALMTWRPEPVDDELLRLGREIERRFQVSWWDSLVVAAAQRQGCVVLLTEDLQHGMRFGAVEVMSPFKVGAEERLPAPFATSQSSARGRTGPGRRRTPRGAR